jgi:hypothetical protein
LKLFTREDFMKDQVVALADALRKSVNEKELLIKQVEKLQQELAKSQEWTKTLEDRNQEIEMAVREEANKGLSMKLKVLIGGCYTNKNIGTKPARVNIDKLYVCQPQHVRNALVN